ncbi:hypothetical protein PFICI_02336 [Pestalotiopsis fici W106-1]|uniref:FAD dependent oxidoreductase domain-containing protein n=1 Tax=Pestalotiopsis fici (strain W106-1 / CGMCC3.15140) TaxID=1229662 RepID=W3XGJ0_PESFW|nr:uncharacterized protein PFICI_02336 [Pestalotiopsis fici W106-1]ETS84311.1 hypothetical protein PFICI_02336 [Pestalotiopsis fici W106-1]
MTSSTVVLGAGIIGASTAYYLGQHQTPSSIHIVDPSPELFESASGYAGGFLARDWFSSQTSGLGALSFDEHRKLAEAEDGGQKWGYMRSTPISFSPGTMKGQTVVAAGRAEAASRTGGNGVAPPWLYQGDGGRAEAIGEEGTVAQVDPLQLSRFLLQKCLESGVKLHHPAKATSVMTDTRNEISSVRIMDTRSGTESDIPCTNIVITAGAWSPQVFAALFPRSQLKLPISSLAGHSLVIQSPRWTAGYEAQAGCHAVFVSGGSGYSPEIFSRAGGHIYIAGLNSATEPLPLLATDSRSGISKSAIAQLRATACEILGRGQIEIVREGLCFRPTTSSGSPIIGRIPDTRLGEGVTTRPGADGGVYLAAGHGPWGISLSLGTGRVLAEMIQGRKLSADISMLGL